MKEGLHGSRRAYLCSNGGTNGNENVVVRFQNRGSEAFRQYEA